jgi:hypothetical protein
MRYGPCSIVCLCLVLGTSCGFDASGVGDSAADAEDAELESESESDGDGDGDPGDGDPGDGDGDSGDGDGDTGDGDGDSGDGDGDSGDGDGDSGDGDGDTGDGDGDPCIDYEFEQVLLASAGQTEAPMGKYGDANESPGIHAQSEIADAGTITWTFEVECPIEVVIWGVVWDEMPGALDNDADSFWARVDLEDPEWKWVYGCETDNTMAGWTYQRVSHNAGSDICNVGALSWDLDAGMHTFRLRNRESSPDFQAAAAVARVLVTSDFDHVPTIANN